MTEIEVTAVDVSVSSFFNNALGTHLCNVMAVEDHCIQ
jgi:hypothetical protein